MSNDMMSTAERILAAREQAEKDNLVAKEERDAWRAAVNTIAETKEGELFLSKLVKFMNLFKDYRGINPQSMAEINGGRAFYFNFIRPYLEPTNIQKVEK